MKTIFKRSSSAKNEPNIDRLEKVGRKTRRHNKDMKVFSVCTV